MTKNRKHDANDLVQISHERLRDHYFHLSVSKTTYIFISLTQDLIQRHSFLSHHSLTRTLRSTFEIHPQQRSPLSSYFGTTLLPPLELDMNFTWYPSLIYYVPTVKHTVYIISFNCGHKHISDIDRWASVYCLNINSLIC